MTLPFDTTDATPLMLAVGIVLATFISEDLTSVAAGLLVADGRLGWPPAVAAFFVGLALGDAGTWVIGRAGGRWVRRMVPEPRLARFSDLIARHGGAVAFVSRAIPGTRVPLLLAAGAAPRGGVRLLAWALLAAAVWAPLVILVVARLGTGIPWWVLAGGVMIALVAVRLGRQLSSEPGRVKLWAAVSRVWRWEFWPAWVFYLPLVPWFLLLAARHRSLTVWTAANPGITPAGGVVSESKSEILSHLPAAWVVPTLLIPADESGQRAERAVREIAARGWGFPLVLKPDAGERGAGVRKAHSAADVANYLVTNPHPVVAQPFHPGPFEAGVFYYRPPGEGRGRVFSITDKVFPVVVGDGRSTLEELIWAHPRFRMQANTFLARHAAVATRVPADGERLPLAMAGNHCQGTLFRDGSHLLTPALEEAIDRIVKPFDGFHVGRFDVRYSDEGEFKAGRGFAVVELNGVTAESTNLYDPTWSLLRAYRTLFRQWALLFRIGHRNRLRGHRPAGVGELLALLRAYSRERASDRLAD
jgi:membrane protein DedA with SNARE-associated domain